MVIGRFGWTWRELQCQLFSKTSWTYFDDDQKERVQVPHFSGGNFDTLVKQRYHLLVTSKEFRLPRMNELNKSKTTISKITVDHKGFHKTKKGFASGERLKNVFVDRKQRNNREAKFNQSSNNYRNQEELDRELELHTAGKVLVWCIHWCRKHENRAKFSFGNEVRNLFVDLFFLQNEI